MKMNFKPKHNDVNQSPPISKKEIKSRIGVLSCRPRDLMHWLSNGIIAPYSKNRGGQHDVPKVGGATVSSVKDHFHNISFAGSVLCLVNDELRNKYNLPPKTKFIVSDGHSRMTGLFRRWYEGNMTQKELDCEIIVMVTTADEFMKVHALKNTQVSQTSVQTLGNPDLLYGDIIINKILPKCCDLAHEIHNKRPGQLRTQFGYIINALKDRTKQDFNYVNAFASRGRMKKISKMEAGSVDFGLTDDDYTMIAKSVDWYCEYVTLLKEKVGNTSAKDLKDVLKSGPFFGLVVIDHMSDHPRVIPVKKSAKVFACQSARNLGQLARMCPNITSSSAFVIASQIAEISNEVKKH